MKFLLPLALCVASAVLSSCGKGDSAPGGSAPGGNSSSGGATASASAFADKGPPDVPPKGPATPAEAAATLDLNTMPLADGTVQTPEPQRTIANFSSNVKAKVKDAYDFYLKQLTGQRWKIDPNSYVSDDSASATFSRNTFHVSLTVSPISEPGTVRVDIHNSGNVDLSKLPRPPVIKTTYEGPITAMYLSGATVPATAEACNKLLLDAGWQPYGSVPNTTYFKKNAIRLTVTVSEAPAEGGKTMISYFSEQMSADIPLLPEAGEVRYDDTMRRLSLEMPIPREKIAEQYQQLLAKDGWKSTTDKLVTDDRRSFMVFRLPDAILDLDIKVYGDTSRATLSFTTFAEYKEMEKKWKEKQEAKKKP